MRKLSIVYKLLLYTVIMIALFLELFPDGGFRAGGFLYFTVQSNLFVAFCLFLFIVIPENYYTKVILRGISLMAIILTGIIYNFILYKIYLDWGTVGYTFPRTVTHLIAPVGYIFDWIFFDRHGEMRWYDLFLWLAYPLLYAYFLIDYGRKSGFYIYAFLNISNGYQTIILAAYMLIGITVTLLVLDKLLNKISNGSGRLRARKMAKRDKCYFQPNSRA